MEFAFHLKPPNDKLYVLGKASPGTCQEEKLLALAREEQNKTHSRYKCLLRKSGTATTSEETWQASL